MSFLSGNHLGSLGFLGDDATGGSSDPNTPVINLTTNTDALPTNGPTPLATTSATDVPTTPSDPMTFSAPVPLAVVDPNSIPTAPPPVVTVAATPKSNSNTKLLLIGAGLLGVYLLTSNHLSGSKSKGRSSHSRRHRSRR